MFLVEIMLYTLGSALMFGIIARRLRNGIYFFGFGCLSFAFMSSLFIVFVIHGAFLLIFFLHAKDLVERFFSF